MGFLRRCYRTLASNKMALAGGLIVVSVVLLAALYPLVGPYDPLEMSVRESFQPPSWAHPLGTDSFGRDQFARIAHAFQMDLLITLAALALALVLGVPLGLISGFYGNVIDNVIMRLLDIIMAFPPIVLAIAIIAAVGPNTHNVALIIGLVYAPIFARITRGQTLIIKNEEYVAAAKSMGRSSWGTLYRHVLPNGLHVITAQAMLQASFAILTISALSFLGLGIQPPDPSLGVLLKDGIAFMHYAAWLSVLPGFAIFYISLGLNLTGEGLIKLKTPR